MKDRIFLVWDTDEHHDDGRKLIGELYLEWPFSHLPTERFEIVYPSERFYKSPNFEPLSTVFELKSRLILITVETDEDLENFSPREAGWLVRNDAGEFEPAPAGRFDAGDNFKPSTGANGKY